MNYSREADSAKDIIDSLYNRITELEEQIQEDNVESLRNRIGELEEENSNLEYENAELRKEIEQLDLLNRMQ